MHSKAMYNILDSGLTKTHRLLAWQMAMLANQRGTVPATLHELAEGIGISYSNLNRHMDDLLAANFVTRIGHGRLEIVDAGAAIDEAVIDLPKVTKSSVRKVDAELEHLRKIRQPHQGIVIGSDGKFKLEDVTPHDDAQ